jgi:stearoyl-CoA desaturase (delta-9 desaturase)
MRAALRRLPSRLAPADTDRIDWFLSAPFLALQLSVLLVPWLGFGAREAAVAAATYGLGMFFVTAGYHRYFAHRAFRTSRAFQLVLAVGAQCTVQRGVLWWAGHHREHHRWSDGPRDVHSPTRGLLWSHLGWFLCNRHEAAPLERVRDLTRFPELVWLERYYWVPPLALGVAVAALGGGSVLVGGYFLGLFLVHHVTFTINSLAHRWGTQPYPTGDDSRNNALLAVFTFGEGWHNNHHWSPSSARQGFRWWQLDLTWAILRVLERLGVVRELRPAPAADHPRPALPGPRLARPAGALLAALVLALPRPAAAQGGAERFVGTARTRGGAVLYQEAHEVELDRGRPVSATTVYRDPSGQPIAELHTDFSHEPFAPSYAFLDLRTGKAERVEVGERELRLEAGGRATTLARPEGLTTGQGLDRLVRSSLGALAAGEVVRVAYAIPSRHDAYTFRIRAVGPEAGPRLRVRVELASFPLRLLAPALEVEYDRETGRLVRYRGASNLSFGDGANPQVEITYAYPEAPGASEEAPLVP